MPVGDRMRIRGMRLTWPQRQIVYALRDYTIGVDATVEDFCWTSVLYQVYLESWESGDLVAFDEKWDDEGPQPLLSLPQFGVEIRYAIPGLWKCHREVNHRHGFHHIRGPGSFKRHMKRGRPLGSKNRGKK